MVCQLGDIVRDKFGNELIITDVDLKELRYTVYSLTAEAAYGKIYAEDLKRDFDQIESLQVLMNGVYGANGNVYKGGFVYPSVDPATDKDLWDAVGRSIFTKAYPDDAMYKYCKSDAEVTAKLFKEELGMNVTKVNKKQEAEFMEYCQDTPYPYRPKKIIFNGPATIVIWQDDTKTVVKCGGNEEYDRKLAFKYALHKRYCDKHKHNYLRQFTKALEKTGDPQAAFVDVFTKIVMNFKTVDSADEYFKAIEKHFKKEFES